MIMVVRICLWLSWKLDIYCLVETFYMGALVLVRIMVKFIVKIMVMVVRRKPIIIL